jgi:hypothetical protein
MKKYILSAVVVLVLAACIQPRARHTQKTEYPDGTVETCTTDVYPPRSSKQGSTITIDEEAITVAISGAQSKADLEWVKGINRNKMFLYIGCAVLLLVGAVGLMLPDWLVSNKDAFITIGIAVACIPVIIWADAASKAMVFVLPGLIIAVCVYLAWRYQRKKKQAVMEEASDLFIDDEDVAE